MLSQEYLHPSGQMPAYEWNFNTRSGSATTARTRPRWPSETDPNLSALEDRLPSSPPVTQLRTELETFPGPLVGEPILAGAR